MTDGSLPVNIYQVAPSLMLFSEINDFGHPEVVQLAFQGGIAQLACLVGLVFLIVVFFGESFKFSCSLALCLWRSFVLLIFLPQKLLTCRMFQRQIFFVLCLKTMFNQFHLCIYICFMFKKQCLIRIYFVQSTTTTVQSVTTVFEDMVQSFKH